MSMTVTHHLAEASPKKTVQPSPVFWVAAAAVLIFVVLGCSLTPASFNADDAQIKTMLVGP